jgi:hypothetical protein
MCVGVDDFFNAVIATVRNVKNKKLKQKFGKVYYLSDEQVDLAFVRIVSQAPENVSQLGSADPPRSVEVEHPTQTNISLTVWSRKLFYICYLTSLP